MSARKKMGLPLQMGIGMVLGILVGTLAPKLGISAAFFKPFGDLFINLVRMVVVPLVLATLVSGAASVGDVGRLGRVAAKTLVFYFATTALAVAIGLILGNIFQPGVGFDLSTANLSAKEVAAPSLVQVLMGIVPLNPVDALANASAPRSVRVRRTSPCYRSCRKSRQAVRTTARGRPSPAPTRRPPPWKRAASISTPPTP